jgi:hypothetical protein
MTDDPDDSHVDEEDKSGRVGALILEMHLKEGERTAKTGMSSAASRAVSAALAGCSNRKLRELKEEYFLLKEQTLEEAISTNTWGLYEDALLKLCEGNRSEEPADEAQALRDAEDLYRAAPGKIGTDAAKLVEILCTRNGEQMDAIRKAYENKYRRSLEVDIGKDTHGLFEDDNFGDLMVMLLTMAPPAGGREKQ